MHPGLSGICTKSSVFFFFCPLLQCVVGGCNASFASQGGLARHVPSHFSQQSSSKMSSQAKLKEESPSKAGLNKRKKLKNKRRCSLRTYLSNTHYKPHFKMLLIVISLFSLLVRITSWTHLSSITAMGFFFLASNLLNLFVGETKGWTTHIHILVPARQTVMFSITENSLVFSHRFSQLMHLCTGW